jgi:hypothetical protein
MDAGGSTECVCIPGNRAIARDRFVHCPFRHSRSGAVLLLWKERELFDFTESVLIEAPHLRVWEVLSDIDCWWLASNPEHESLEHLDSLAPTQVGARLRIREKTGGIPGEAVGTITAVDPGNTVTWEADARYRWLGVFK